MMLQLPTPLPVPQLEKLIRLQLDFICNVVKAYDSEGSAVGFGCNVMRYVDAAGPGFAAQQASLQARTKCIETGVAISNLAGVLDLQLPLSIHSTSSSQPDANLVALALPVPRNLANGTVDITKVLPGAPYAFAARKELVFGNLAELIDEAERNRGFSSTVVNELKEVFRAQQNSIQALICIPLYPPPVQPSVAGMAPIGVLNIHRNTHDQHTSGKFEHLSPLLAPLVENLGNLVARLP